VVAVIVADAHESITFTVKVTERVLIGFEAMLAVNFNGYEATFATLLV
jgi:carbonic anhydrase/acetyltransferase-like protein (isoleucine patch superfamily)